MKTKHDIAFTPQFLRLLGDLTETIGYGLTAFNDDDNEIVSKIRVVVFNVESDGHSQQIKMQVHPPLKEGGEPQYAVFMNDEVVTYDS